MPSPATYRLQDVSIDVAAMRICRGSEELSLEPKTFRLLLFLIENCDRVVSKQEIFRVVWEDRAVSDNALTRAIAQIRKALDDDPRNPRFIDTIPTVGYRFIGVMETDSGPAVQTGRSERHLSRIAIWAGLAVGLSAVVMVAMVLHFRPTPRQRRMSSAIPLTTYRGSEDAPSFSPDGNQIAFQWNGEKQDNTDIYVKTLGFDSTPLRLTSDPAPDRNPAWAPDGLTIAFIRFVSADRFELKLIPALGGPERKLGDYPLPIDRIGIVPAWSLDSKWLAVPVASPNGTTLYRISVDSGEATPLLKPQDSLGDICPELSPDGNTLVFLRHPTFNWGQVWTVHVDSSLKAMDEPRQLHVGEVKFLTQAHWTPDGKELIVRGPSGAFRVPAQGTDDPEPFPALGSYYGRSLAISRRGNRLAFTQIHGDANIYRVDLKARTPHPEPLISSTVRDVYPKYSPDGRKITFHTNRSETDSQQVWVADATGEHVRQLTFMQAGVAGTAHWSPDGQTIIFDSNATGVYQIYAMDPEGAHVRQLTSGNFGSFGANWARDGKWIYYASSATGRNELWKMPAEGGKPVQLTRNGSMGGIESPDGKTIYFCKESGSGSIWQMPSEGGQEVQIVDSLWRSNFAVSQNGIYYMTAPRADGTSQLMFYSLDEKKSRLLVNIGVPEYGLDVSPDGRYLVYAQLDEPASDLMLIENFR